MRRRAITIVLGLATVVVACKKDAAPGGAGSDPTAAAGSATPPPPSPRPVLEIFVNDTSVAKLDAPQVAAWPRLDTLVPVSARRLGTWQLVRIAGGTTKAELAHPSEKYPELVPAVYPAAGGAAFGMFDPVELAKHGKPALTEPAREIRITIAQGTGRGEHETGEGGGSDPSQLEIAIVTPKGKSTLTGKTLLAIAREPAPGETEPKGWTLATVLHAAGIDTFERLLLAGGGANLTLDRADVDPKTSVPYVKLNRSGALRLRVYKKQGDTWQPGSDLRGLAEIRVVK